MTSKTSEAESHERDETHLSDGTLPARRGPLPDSLEVRYLATLLDNLPGVAFVCRNDVATSIEYVSLGAVKILGYTPQHLIAEGAFAKIVHPKDRINNKRLMDALTPANPTYTTNFRIRTNAGEYLWVNEQAHGLFDDDGSLRVVVGLMTNIQEQKRTEERLVQENQRLKAAMKTRGKLVNLVGRSLGMQKAYDSIIKAAESDRPVTITGESGTGKELAARAIHELGADGRTPFVTVNCGAIPENLFEREFFGHKRGAFSGAYKNESGYLAQSDGGCLFLDEIGELPLQMQVKLLRALDGGGYTPVGGGKPRFPRFRLITATNRDLTEMVAENRMRQDFFYRINVLPIWMPPLRDRRSDIPLLVRHFLDKWLGSEHAVDIPETVMLRLMDHDWPGNVRELENVLSRYLTFGHLEFSQSPTRATESPDSLPAMESEGLTDVLDRVEKRMILETLDKQAWRLSPTARDLGISLRTLHRKLKKHGIR